MRSVQFRIATVQANSSERQATTLVDFLDKPLDDGELGFRCYYASAILAALIQASPPHALGLTGALQRGEEKALRTEYLTASISSVRFSSSACPVLLARRVQSG